MHDFKSFLLHLSHHPGVYQMLDEKGEVIYVGKAKDLKKRLSSYFSSRVKDPKTTSLVKQINDIHITVTRTENEAVLLECNLIKQHRPRYNVLLRDDKSYPYILMTTQHAYPRITLYRGPRKKIGTYFGPYPSSLAVREAISLLQKLFRLRTCTDAFFAVRTRPCLLYQIKRCTGPCVELISKEEYAEQVKLAMMFLEGKNDVLIQQLQAKMESASTDLDFEAAANYRDQINRLRQIQDPQYVNVDAGNADIIGFASRDRKRCLQLLSIRQGQLLGSRAYFPDAPFHANDEEIMAAFLTQYYLGASVVGHIPRHIIVKEAISEKNLIENVLSDQAKHLVNIIYPKRGEKKKWLEMATASAKQSLATQQNDQAQLEARISALQTALKLKKLERMECFDISHTMGEATVASCVVFNREGPVKSNYRRFNITDIVAGDDVAAMAQVLSRRFKRLQSEEAMLPDVVFIDGGKPQLSAVKKIRSTLAIHSVLFIGVSKGPARRAGEEILHLLLPDGGISQFRLLPDSQALHLIQSIRDEAHRFAITGHRMRRDKVRRHSQLEDIAGIGPGRRRALLRYFGGIQGVAHASLEELIKVPGISRPLAERIFATLHDATL